MLPFVTRYVFVRRSYVRVTYSQRQIIEIPSKSAISIYEVYDTRIFFVLCGKMLMYVLLHVSTFMI